LRRERGQVRGIASATVSRTERRFLVLLGLPAFALSLAVTTVSGLLPVLLEAKSGPLVAGALVAMEGVFALVVPPLVGPRSDRHGRRLPFIAAAGALSTAALVLMALGGPLWLFAVWIALFQIGYFAYLTPYFALYPDLVDADEAGRAQGLQGAWRSVGLGIAFVVGPALLGVWRGAPFLVAAAVLVLVTPWFGAIVMRRVQASGRQGSGGAGGFGGLVGLVRSRPPVGWFVVANALWETALAALRAFAVLFVVQGLGRTEAFASAVLAVVVVGSVFAAPLSGWLADRMGERRVMAVCLWVYGLGALVPAFTQSVAILPVVLLVALAAVSLMTLPYALLMGLLPERDHGAGAALFAISRGFGLLAGPLLAGVAITVLRPTFEGTDGYAALFLVVSASVLVTLPLLRRLRPESR
jgi:MFS family permease